MFGIYDAIVGRDLNALQGSILFTAISLIYVGPILLPIGAVAAYYIRKRQTS